MMLSRRRAVLIGLTFVVAVLLLSTTPQYYRAAYRFKHRFKQHTKPLEPTIPIVVPGDGKFHWANVPEHYPVKSIKPLPTGKPASIPKIQYPFEPLSAETQTIRAERRHAVKDAFLYGWRAYRYHAWCKDELKPVSAGWSNNFGGWAVTLIESLGKLCPSGSA